MTNKSYLLLLLPLFFLTACFDEDVFKKSDRNQIKALYVANPLNNGTTLQANIVLGDGTDANPDLAHVSLPPGSVLTDVTISSMLLPSLAYVVPDYSKIKDYTSVQTFYVYAENGKDKRRLDVVMNIGEYERQIKYSSLTNYWTPVGQFDNGNYYYNVGEDNQYTPWANTNVVAAILKKSACLPSNFPTPTGHVVLNTLYNQTGGTTVGSGIASANLFAGSFRANPDYFLDREKQRQNTDHGIPFVYKPRAIKFEYKYTPGTQVVIWERVNSRWQPRELSEIDSMEVYAVLQKRIYDSKTPSQTKYYRIGSGGFISSETVTEWRTQEITLFYGRENILNSASVEPTSYRMAGINKPNHPLWVYQHAKSTDENGNYGSPTQNTQDPTKWNYLASVITEEWAAPADEPTHLVLSFSSSAGGYLYKGAGRYENNSWEPSILEIRNVELIY